MSENCNHDCSSCSQDCESRDMKAHLNEYSSVKHVYGIVSGKGGVGKSLVTGLMGVISARNGFHTAILDADITGPSIGKMFGIEGKAMAIKEGILPIPSQSGVEVMSLNMLVENETDPVIWRGPMIGGVVKQFYSDVYWKDIDYMFVDMPPGTSDVPLTVFQSLPVEGIIIVTSPQELVSMIVAKAVKMAQMMNIPILGIVENMSYVSCPTCNEKIYAFGESHVQEIAKEYNLKVLAQIPVDSKLAKACDNGKIEEYFAPFMEELEKNVYQEMDNHE